MKSAEFCLFAVLMVVDMAVFVLLCTSYTYVDYSSGTDEEVESPKKTATSEGHTNKAFSDDA